MSNKGKNPFRKLFFGIAVICCIALSGAFYYVGYANNLEDQKSNAYSKAEMIMTDFVRQLQTLETVGLEIASDYEFHPYYFKEGIDRELAMLNKLESFGGYLTLSDEYFLYYGGERIYLSSGHSINLELLLRDKINDKEEIQQFRNVLIGIRDNGKDTKQQSVLAVSEKLYVFMPLSVRENYQQAQAVLIYEIQPEELEKRFQLVSGGVEGKIALFAGDEVIYSNEHSLDWVERNDVLKVFSTDMRYKMLYLPQKESYIQSALILHLTALILIEIVFIYLMADIFAKKAFKPVSSLINKYREESSGEVEKSYQNALEELSFLLSKMKQDNMDVKIQIEKDQQLLRNYILQRLLEASGTFGSRQDLENAKIHLPGPLYCVLSVSFKDQLSVTKELVDHLQEALEQMTNENEQTYIYAVYNVRKKVVNVICSFLKENQGNMLELIREIVESFGCQAYVNCGNVYESLSSLSASWMESMDGIYSDAVDRRNTNQEYIYDTSELHKISTALECGNEKAAKESLEEFLEQTSKMQLSLLMQHYIIADFLGEMRKLSERYRHEISKKNVSLLLSSKNLHDFKIAAEGMIDEFIEFYNSMKDKMQDDKSREIYQYINTHFNDYDISIESIADNLHTSSKNVRDTVLKYTGRMYREYLVHLRIEYAKVLLIEENLPVSEICYKVGYSNISYFIRLFREVTGTTPAKYRENNRGEREKDRK